MAEQNTADETATEKTSGDIEISVKESTPIPDDGLVDRMISAPAKFEKLRKGRARSEAHLEFLTRAGV